VIQCAVEEDGEHLDLESYTVTIIIALVVTMTLWTFLGLE